MLLSIRHTTRYEFSLPVAHGLQRLRLRPRPTHGQAVVDWAMTMENARPQVEYDDQHMNHTSLILLEPGTREVVVTCAGTVDTTDNDGILGEHVSHMPLWCFLRATPLTSPGPEVRALLEKVDADRHRPLEFLHTLSQAVREAIEFETGVTTAGTSAEQALAGGRGVCQDHAHVFIAAGRLADIPMRYVGGYLKIDGRVEQDAGHGWAEAHVPGLGWVGFDVSNAICPDERYVRVATGCDYSEAAPVTGIALSAGQIELKVDLSVEEKQVGKQQQQQGSWGQPQSQGI